MGGDITERALDRCASIHLLAAEQHKLSLSQSLLIT